MAIDFVHYAGREPAFVKHTFLDKYLPALIGRVASRYNSFVYVDGFAGPWKSVAGETFADTSFGIALQHMTAQKILYAARGRDVQMKAFLVEKDQKTFDSLKQAIGGYPNIDCEPLLGGMEEHVSKMIGEISPDTFSFVLIDPKGFPDVEAIMPLIRRQHSEALVNFMFDFANRFAATSLIPALEKWLSSEGNARWKAEVERLAGKDREERLETLAVEKLRKVAAYKYAPVISVDKPLHDRTLYKLIFLTRHTKGLQVFRDSEHAALEAQAASRSITKAGAREVKSGMADFFGAAADVALDRSTLMMKAGEDSARAKLLGTLKQAGSAGVRWGDLWPPVLESTVVTHSRLGRIANELRKIGVIRAPNWPSERHKIPRDDQLLLIA
jgi:three-Cys-motif partner protein